MTKYQQFLKEKLLQLQRDIENEVTLPKDDKEFIKRLDILVDIGMMLERYCKESRK